jgi:hypothetical protein
MRRAERCEPLDPLGMTRGEPPANCGAPVMTDHTEPTVTDRLGKTYDIVGEQIEAVSGESLGRSL